MTTSSKYMKKAVHKDSCVLKVMVGKKVSSILTIIKSISVGCYRTANKSRSVHSTILKMKRGISYHIVEGDLTKSPSRTLQTTAQK